MVAAFFYLTWRSWWNRLRARVLRLRQPRYLAGLAVGLLYMYWFIVRPSRTGGLLPLWVRYSATVEVMFALLLFVLVLLTWVWPSSGRPALAFSRAEVQFLFPAPFTRRQLVRYKVLRAQLGATLGSVLMTLFLRPTSVGMGWTFFVGLWVAMAVINLYGTGVGLRRQSLREHRAIGLARQWFPLVVVLGALMVLGRAVVLDWARLTTAGGFAVFEEAARVFSSGAAGVVLWPFRALVRLPLAGDASAFLRAAPFALGILLAMYVWVEQSDAAFEETSATYAERAAASPRAGRSAAPRVGKAATPFALSLTGSAEVAFLWKNLILFGRFVSLKSAIRFVPILIIGAMFLSKAAKTGGMADAIGALCLFAVPFTILMGPQATRNDLRSDLGQLATLRTWPLRGATIVRGEVLAPTVVLTVITWALIIGAALGAHRAPAALLADRFWYGAAAMLIAPGLILTQVVIHNAIAVLFPAWVQIGSARTRGVDAMGQRMLMLAALLIVLAVSLLPAALAAGAVVFAIYSATAVVPVLAPAVVALAVLIGECLIAIEAIGRMLERIDVREIGATE